MYIMVLKVKSIIITLLFLFTVYTPAYATVYLNLDAEGGTVGQTVPNPPFCQTECSGNGAKATYQSSGGTPQGSKYYQWQTADNQTEHYTEIFPPNGSITNIMGKTYYLAWFFRYDRINGLDIWHEGSGIQSASKDLYLWGSYLRWGFLYGQWESHAPNQDHRYSIYVIDSNTYNLNPEIKVVDTYVQNQNGYNRNNPIQLQYEQWHSAVFAVKITSDKTGSFTLYIDGVKVYEINNIQTVANASPDIGLIVPGGTIAQPAYDAPAYISKWDAYLLTDNWQDIVDGGYLSSDTPPPSGGNPPSNNSGNGGDSGGGSSGGSGCGFVKDDGKGLRAKGEGVSTIIFFLLLILLKIKKANHLLRAMIFKSAKAGIAKTMLFFITTALIFLLFTGITHAATYYVSPTGTAQWPACTDISTPCTAKTAMENAIAGDIVYFRGGVYNPIDDPVQQWLDTPVQFRYQLPVWNPKNSGTEGNPITFMAYHGETPEILDAPDSAVLGAYRRDYIVLDGFRATLIDEDPLSNDTHLVSQLIRFDESLHSVIRNCDFKGTKFGRHTNNSLITIQRSHYMLIEGNKLHDNNGLQDTDPEFKEYAVNTNAIINFWSSDIVIRNNDIYNNYIGIWDKGSERNNQYYHNHIWGGSDYYTSCKQGIYMRATLNVQGPATGVRAYQNVIRNCGVGVQIEDVSYHDFPEVRVYNNTIVGNDSYHNNAGVFVADNARYAEIFNNIIVGYPVQVRYYTGASTIVSYSNYNDFYSSSANKRWAINWSNDYSTIDLWRAATNLDINSIESNPQFINPGGANPADYKLQANSPARIGRGGSYATVMGAFITGNETIGYDPDAPRVEITSPPNSTVTTTNTSITISGTAADTLGIVSVTWRNDRGGSGTAWSGTATQNVNWTVSNIPLQSGQNIITVTATDGDGKTGVDVLIINPTNSNGGNTPPSSSGGDSSTSGGSGCGFVKDDGKGQRAKGEGVALMMMLIISLIVIFVLGRSIRRIKVISIILKAFILAIFMAVLLLPAVSLAANYYIDYQSGSDANSGTSKLSPWQRAPGMAGFSEVYTHQAGDKFIFKGGVTWPSAVFPLTVGYSGDAAASDGYTVDKTWYAGSSWTRPVFDGENLTQKFIAASNKHYIIIDNIEFTKSDTDYTDSYGNMPYPLYLTSISHWEIKNNYFHDLNAQYSGTPYDNGGYTIYIQASGGFISIHDNRAERLYMHRFAVVGPSSDFSTFEFYNNTVSDVAVGLVFGANNAYTFDNIQIHDNDFSKPYMPYADHSLDGSLTQLNGAVDALQTTINVVNGAVFTSGYNFVIQIGSEYIYVPAGGRTGNTLNNVTRGYAGSTAQAHANLDSVGFTCSDPWHGDYIHIYQIGSGSITNAKIYNNYFHPGYSGPMPPYPCNSSTWDGGMTAYLYLENHLASPLIYNNIFEGDDEGISMQFSLRNATNPLVMNNTFIGSNKKIGLGIADASINAVVKNNIFSNVKYGITVSADSLSGFTSDNNNFHGLNAVGQFGSLQCTGNSTFCSSLSDWQNILGGCPNAGNDCSSSTDNPLLDGNYRPISSSPLTVRDAGAALSSYFSADKDGVSRPQGSAWDIGAYEYCASGSCTGSGGGDTGGNTGGSGGDSGGGSSGGSGCGFVKDDNGKGQWAKVEGLSVVIMLIIALKIISVTLHQLKKRKTL